MGTTRTAHFMRIAEIYKSVQGEGRLTGTSSVFVRASGCNLRCHFCDTPHTSWFPEGDDLSVDDIVERVLSHRVAHVVVTGGEPMLFAELIPLCERLRREGCHLTIETAGTLHLSVECDLMSVSPKLANSTPSLEQANGWHHRHEATRDQRDIVQRLISEYSYQLKFVVASHQDAEEVLRYLETLPRVERKYVWMMPEGIDVGRLNDIAVWLAPFCNAHGLVFGPRQHIHWFGHRRGT